MTSRQVRFIVASGRRVRFLSSHDAIVRTPGNRGGQRQEALRDEDRKL